jgi:hypothetical protein
MKKSLCAMALIMGMGIAGGQVIDVGQCGLGFAVADARSQPKIEVMERELKKNKGFETSDIYRRSHDIIYGDDKPARDGRVRIAVVINGDENMVVEDRIKNQVYSRLRQKFPIDYFAVIKGTDINSRLLQYAEDMYYDQREYATTRETEYNQTKSSRGISLKISGNKNIFNSVTDSNHNASTTGNSSGSRNGNTSNSGYYDNDLTDDAYDGRWTGSGSSNDSYNNNYNSSTAGTGHVNKDTDHKGWGATLGIGGGTSSVSGDETRVTKSSKVDVDGMAIGNRPRGLADMRRMDYVRAGRECNYDYVFVLTLSNGKGKVYGHDYILFNTNTVTKNIWLRVRLIDVQSGNYLYRNDIAAMGKTHNGHINGRVLERSVASAMKEAMDDIKVSER